MSVLGDLVTVVEKQGDTIAELVALVRRLDERVRDLERQREYDDEVRRREDESA